MARNAATVLTNNLSRGLITEATGLNYPDNAVIETWNSVFEKVGRVTRRRGIDLESDAESVVYEVSDGVVNEFVWQSVSLTGGYTFLVIQVGFNIFFYDMTVNESLSAGIVPTPIDLRNYMAPGAGDLRFIPASFTSGNGYLFIAHPKCDTLVVRFDKETNSFIVSRIEIMIRDLEGVDDGLAVDEETSALDAKHLYNLKNQGWYKPVRAGSSNNEVGLGSLSGLGFEFNFGGF